MCAWLCLNAHDGLNMPGVRKDAARVYPDSSTAMDGDIEFSTTLFCKTITDHNGLIKTFASVEKCSLHNSSIVFTRSGSCMSRHLVEGMR